MSVRCTSCKALHWIQERLSGSTIALPQFETCCKKDNVQLELLRPPPAYLQYLLDLADTIVRNYRSKIQEYNSALAFTSLKYQPDN